MLSVWESLKRTRKKPYDELFHLSIIVETDKGRVRVEKNDTINITPKPKTAKNEDRINLPVPEGLTLGVMIQRTKERMGKDFLPYDPMKNNCQSFIVAILKANNMDTTENIKFVKQDADDLFNPLLRKVGRTLTDIGATKSETLG